MTAVRNAKVKKYAVALVHGRPCFSNDPGPTRMCGVGAWVGVQPVKLLPQNHFLLCAIYLLSIYMVYSKMVDTMKNRTSKK